MSRPYFLTIQKKFLLLFLLVGLIPAVAGVVLTLGGSRLSFAWATANGLEIRAREIADRIGQYTEERHERLRRAVEANDGDLLRTRLDSATRGSADALIRYRPGELPHIVPIESTESRLTELLREHAEQFASYVEGEGIGDVGIVDDLYLRGESWRESTGLILDVYPEPGGGVLIFAAEPGRMLAEARTTLGQDSVLSVYSREGYMLNAPPTDLDILIEARERFSSNAGASAGWFNVRRAAQGRQEWYLVAHAPVPRVARLGTGSTTGASPWMVLLTYDMEIFLGPQSTLLWFTVLVAILWALMLMAVSVFMTRRVVGPVKQLRYQAEAMAAGDLTAQARVRTRDEIQDLAGAFNTMARKLRKSYADLESRVEESQLRADHIFVINEITKTITQALDLDRTFEILKRELPKILKYDALWVAIADKETGKLRVTHAEPKGLIQSLSRGTVPLEYSFHGHSLREMKAVHGVIGPQDDSDPSQSGIFTLLGYRAFLVAPLPSKDRALGTLTLVSKKTGDFGEEEVEILASVASAVAVGIEQAELFRRTRQFAEDLERKVHERTQELARANQELIQAEKHAATGRLGANLAHEINNPLGIIKNYLRITTDSLRRSRAGKEQGEVSLEHLQVIEEEIDRIARIVRQLLDLHRPAEDHPQPTDIAALIQDIVTLMEKDLAQQGIEIRSDLQPNMPHPVVAPDLLRQVYINLLRNAQDAMEDGGTLTIRASETTLGDGADAKAAIRVDIEDTGCGIEPSQMSHLFDPFYTTKSAERGTGLGLYVSYGIVQRYQGTIDVKSEPGEGTCMTVTLPVHPLSPEAGMPSAPEGSVRRSQAAAERSEAESGASSN